MRITQFRAEAAFQMKTALNVFESASFHIPATLIYAPFLAMLKLNTQDFHPRKEAAIAKETIFRHTLKDFIVVNSILMNEPGQIRIDDITFPPREDADAPGKLDRIVEICRSTLFLPAMTERPWSRIIDVFVLFHDIAKKTGDRTDHERIGAERFMKHRGYFIKFLNDKEIKIVYLLIKYHGVYAEICKARNKGEPLPTYDDFVKEMKEKGLSEAEKEFTVKMLFLFNVAEGLQSDVYSNEYYSTAKLEDVLSFYQSVIKASN